MLLACKQASRFFFFSDSDGEGRSFNCSVLFMRLVAGASRHRPGALPRFRGACSQATMLREFRSHCPCWCYWDKVIYGWPLWPFVCTSECHEIEDRNIPRFVGMLRNRRSLSTSKPYISVVFFYPFSHWSPCFTDIDVAAFMGSCKRHRFVLLVQVSRKAPHEIKPSSFCYSKIFRNLAWNVSFSYYTATPCNQHT